MKTSTLDERRLQRLRTLTEVSRALTYARSIDEVLRVTVERAAELMAADKALIMLTDADGLLTVRASHGVDEARVAELREPLVETLIQRLQGLLDYPSADCFLSVPLVSQGRVTGLLAAVRPVGEEPVDDDEWLLSALADQAAVALENARLVQAARAQQEEVARRSEVEGRTHATLVHELRSPLTAVQAYSSLLLEGMFGPLNERQREGITRIRMSGEHLLAIIENVLDAVRINAAEAPLSSVQLSVRDVLSEALGIVQPRAMDREQEIRTTYREEPRVRGDANRLRQALVNLLGNASKYSAPGATIEVVVATVERESERFATIAIRDHGRGIPPGALGRIFDPYDRGGADSTEPGLGLGLFISREIVRQMGGEIHVASELGTGSTFTVSLPLMPESGG